MFHKKKVSIHLCIIMLFVLLLSLVGFTIISINYVALNKILSSSTLNSIQQTSQLIEYHISNYLLPFNRGLLQIRYLMTNNIIDDSKELESIFLEVLRNNPAISAVYYGTVDGDVYGADRQVQGIIAFNNIINSKIPAKRTRYEYDLKNNFLRKTTLYIKSDPRTRPWFQQAIKEGKPTMTNIYKFKPLVKNVINITGVTAAAPIYNKDQLQGVLAMDLDINNIQQFINKLQVTKNSMIYITDEKNQVMAFRNPNEHEDIRGQTLVAEDLKKFKIPISFSKFEWSKQQKKVIFYDYNNQHYLLMNQQVFNVKSNWHITIIVPEKDILAPLRNLSFETLLLTIFILFFGILIARDVSQKISRPIIHLSKEAQKITRLNLKPRPLLKTMIKEISYMNKSLSNMRSSLISFQRYVPSSLVKKLMLSGKIAEVGGEYQNITILFSDIKNFTKLAETTPPKKLMNYLSEYFQLITEAIIMHQGILDKYIGDAIMALWNTPLPDKDHALHACKTAVCMMEKVAQLNIKNKQLELPKLSIRIGIHTGKAVVGNVGSEERLNFTALGDAVNLTSRLEAINKTYNTQIIVSKATYEQVKTHFSFRLLDMVAVRGKQQSTEIYELITVKNLQNLKLHKKEFSKAFDSYQKGNWNESLKLFAKLTPAYPGDKLATLYIQRCRMLLKRNQNWDGVWHTENDL